MSNADLHTEFAKALFTGDSKDIIGVITKFYDTLRLQARDTLPDSDLSLEAHTWSLLRMTNGDNPWDFEKNIDSKNLYFFNHRSLEHNLYYQNKDARQQRVVL